jgi:two-component system NarL family sensor kinase
LCRGGAIMPDSPNHPRISSRNGCDAPVGSGSVAPSHDSELRFRALALEAIDRHRLDRGKLARLLHDEVAQILSGAGLQLDILRMDFEAVIPEIASRTAEIQDLLERVVLHIRDLTYELNPDIVERAGLQQALDLLVGRYRKIFAGSLRLIYDSSVRIPPGAGGALERIAEEALANAVRHACCGQIEIIVKATRGGAVLQVRDDGIGFDYEQQQKVPRGLGLSMMEYSAAKAGLRFSVDGSDGRGSSIRAVAANRKEDTAKQDRPVIK